MPNIYIRADEIVDTLVTHIIDNWHPELKKVQLKVGVLLAISARETQAAVKEGGHPVSGIIKIVALKDRVTKKFDVEMIIDGDKWKEYTHKHRLALIDHLLYRLEVKKPKKKKTKKSKGNEAAVHGSDDERKEHEDEEFITDDMGRPVLKLRKGDWNAGFGFCEVVERHGNFAPECCRMEIAHSFITSAIEAYQNSIAEKEAHNLCLGEVNVETRVI